MIRALNAWMLVLTAGLILGGCAGLPVDAQPLRVTLVAVRPLDMQLLEQRYAASLRIKNPNPETLNVAGLDFKLEINGEDFADGVSNRAFGVPAFGEAVAEIEISSSLLRLIDQVRSLNERNGEGLHYRIEGSVSLRDGWLRLPFERTGRIGMGSDTAPKGS